MQSEPLRASEPITTFERAYPGTVFYLRHVRADLAHLAAAHPAAGDLILLASELAANAIIHSRSGELNGEFIVRAHICPGDYAWIEVEDQGGLWITHEHGDDQQHGLDTVARRAGDANWGVDGDSTCHVVWFRLDWPAQS